MTAEDDDHDAEHAEHDHDEGVDSHEEGEDLGHEQDQSVERDRVTAPMQDYSTSQVTTGFVVLVVGVAIAYLLPSLF